MRKHDMDFRHPEILGRKSNRLPCMDVLTGSGVLKAYANFHIPTLIEVTPLLFGGFMFFQSNRTNRSLP